jgi:cyclopropane fatty-acyl-phospholipid synthase-like methyltransferase
MTGADPRTQLVGAGYDAMIDTWEEWSARIDDDARSAWTAELVERLEPGARVLELGCGGGSAETRMLAGQFALTGVDLSLRQLERARERIPGATFLHGDLTAVDFDPGTFDAVVAYYVFNHVPRELLAPTLARAHAWLTPGGSLLATFGTLDQPEWTGAFLGAETFFSSHPPDVTARIVRDAGFDILRDEVVELREPEGDVRFHWVLASR